MLQNLFKLGAGLQVDGLGADDAGHFLLPHQHGLGDDHAGVDAAHRLVAEKAVVVDAQHHKAHFVHMGGEEDVLFALCAFFIGHEVADGVCPNAVGVRLDVALDEVAHAALVAADAAQQAKLL